MHVLWTRVVSWFRSRAWPLIVGAVGALLSVVLLRRLRRPVDDGRTPAERRAAQRDTEIVLDAIDEHTQRADVAREKAAQAGEAAAYHGHAASEQPQKLRDMTSAERKAELDKIEKRLRAGKKTTIVFALALGVISSTARASETMVHPRTGIEGWWMEDGEHLELAEWAAELVERRDQVADLTVQVSALKIASHHDATATEMCTGVLRATQRRLEATEARADALAAWYRDPRLWGGVGLVGGLVLSAALVMAVQ